MDTRKEGEILPVELCVRYGCNGFGPVLLNRSVVPLCLKLGITDSRMAADNPIQGETRVREREGKTQVHTTITQ